MSLWSMAQTSRLLQIATDILKKNSPSGSPTILVFPYQTGCQYSDGNPPPNGGIECKGLWKKSRFRQISGFISELMQDRAIWKANRKPHQNFRMVPVSMSRYHSTSNNTKTVPDRAIFNGGQIENRIWSTERRHFQWPWTTPNPVFKVTLGHAVLWC